MQSLFDVVEADSFVSISYNPVSRSTPTMDAHITQEAIDKYHREKEYNLDPDHEHDHTMKSYTAAAGTAHLMTLDSGIVVVVKVLNKHNLTNRTYLDEIECEIGTYTSLQEHTASDEVPIFPRFYGSQTTPEDGPILVMEAMDGNLDHFLLQQPWTDRELEDSICAQLLYLARELHRRYNLCHTDLHQGNWLYKMTDHGIRLCIADFGSSCGNDCHNKGFAYDLEIVDVVVDQVHREFDKNRMDAGLQAPEPSKFQEREGSWIPVVSPDPDPEKPWGKCRLMTDEEKETYPTDSDCHETFRNICAMESGYTKDSIYEELGDCKAPHE